VAGIHPPADDIPGSTVGEAIGIRAFSLAERYFCTTTKCRSAPEAQVETIADGEAPRRLLHARPPSGIYVGSLTYSQNGLRSDRGARQFPDSVT
jgi:hypothetical protein